MAKAVNIFRRGHLIGELEKMRNMVEWDDEEIQKTYLCSQFFALGDAVLNDT